MSKRAEIAHEDWFSPCGSWVGPFPQSCAFVLGWPRMSTVGRGSCLQRRLEGTHHGIAFQNRVGVTLTQHKLQLPLVVAKTLNTEGN